jgi:hypothetical protein
MARISTVTTIVRNLPLLCLSHCSLKANPWNIYLQSHISGISSSSITTARIIDVDFFNC